MRKLLLLDADVIMDLHTLGLFGKIKKAYNICLTRAVLEEARLGIDPGESTSIAYLIQTDEQRNAGYHEKNLYPRHLEKTFKAAVNEGKTLRIQFKRLI